MPAPSVASRRERLAAVIVAAMAAATLLAFGSSAPLAGVVISDLSVDGFPAPGLPPALSNKITLHRYQSEGPGSPPPRVALVLFPCAACGTGWLDPLARDLASRGGVAVFTADGRGVALEDRARLDAMRLGNAKGADEAIAFYLGAGGKPAVWKRPGPEDLLFMAIWGSRLAHEDVRSIVREVRRLSGLPVVIGGFSGGAGVALGFAAKLFADGRAGHEEIAGLVLLDGGVRMESDADQAAVRERIERWRSGLNLDVALWDMRDDQIRAEIAALLELQDPQGRSPLARGAAGAELAAAGITNQAFFGWTLDFGQPPERGALSPLYQVQMGSLILPAAPGRPAEWRDGGEGAEPVRSAQVAAAARAPGGLFDWYYPSRLVREETSLFLDGWSDPNFGLTELGRISAPIFSVTTATDSILGPGKPPLGGTWLFSRVAAKGNEAYVLPEMRCGDILFADAARERVFAPLHRWILKIAQAKGSVG